MLLDDHWMNDDINVCIPMNWGKGARQCPPSQDFPAVTEWTTIHEINASRLPSVIQRSMGYEQIDGQNLECSHNGEDVAILDSFSRSNHTSVAMPRFEVPLGQIEHESDS
jgi:hypothetical protein